MSNNLFSNCNLNNYNKIVTFVLFFSLFIHLQLQVTYYKDILNASALY